jgi:hypothetical protein
MASKFPAIRPTSRTFTMGDYPSKTYTSLSGVIFKRAFGNRQTGYTLNLTFRNIGDTSELRSLSGTAKQIIDHYNSVDGTYDKFTLPDRMFAGMDDGLESLIQAPTDISWRYAAPPQVQSVKAGVSTVTVRLVGELDVL